MTDSKRQGIYILANDDFIEDAIALLNSLRQHAPDYPVRLIPYDDRHQRVAQLLRDKFGVEKFEDQYLFDVFEKHARAILGRSAPMCRTLAMWFGPFDEFIYLDVDIVVFQNQRDVFDMLTEYDFVCCADGRTLGIKHVFTERVLERNLFTEQEINYLFNTGMYASKKGVLGYAQLISLLEETATIPDIFLPYYQDQTILNYLVLRAIPKRADLRDFTPAIPDDAWAGLSNLKVRKDKAYKVYNTELPARHLHWAGFKQIASRPHVGLWLMYRYPGKVGAIKRPLVRLWWLISRITRRVLCTHDEGWYTPSYQLKRAQRIISRRITSRLQQAVRNGKI